MTMSVLDATIVAVALPTIAADLSSGPARSVWIVNAYQIAIIMTLLPAGALGAALGYRRVYLAGLALFTAMSLACALSNGLTVLVVARFAQGIGAAAMMALNGALMRAVYPRSLFARGIGRNGMVIATSAAAGPSLAVALLAAGSWPWLFFINLPLGLVSLLIGSALLPGSNTPWTRFDTAAAIASAIAFAAVFVCVAGLIGNLPIVWSVFAFPAGMAAIILLARRSWGEHPLVPIDLILTPVLRRAYLASICGFAAQGCVLVALPFILHRIGFGVIAIGGVITPLPIGVGLGSLVAGRLLGRWPGGGVATIGLALATTGLISLILATTEIGTPFAIGLSMAGFGVGFGIFQTANNQIMLTSAQPIRASAASAMLSLVRVLGQLAGALIAALGLKAIGAASYSAVLAEASPALVT